jgi:uncharacterized protein (TIGR03435 family)
MKAAIFLVAAVTALTALAAAAPLQTGSNPARPRFEAATIKRAAPDAVRNQNTPVGPNRLYIPSMTLRALVYQAYGDGGFNTAMRVTGGPDWSGTMAFSVEGVAAGPATPRELRVMLQTLLAERFALKVRDASLEDAALGDTLALVIDRSDGTLGPKIRKWDGTCPSVMPALVYPAPRRTLQRVDDKFVVAAPSAADDANMPYCPTGYRVGGMIIDGGTMATVAEMLSLPPARALLGTIAEDRTGLTGRYTLELDYLFTGTAPPPDFTGPSLATALKEQWGLRLVPTKSRLKLIVIESAEMPTGN